MLIKRKKGFTLIELLAVIIILGIVMALIIPEISKVIEKSQKKLIENSIRGLMRAVDIAQKEFAIDDDYRSIIFTYTNGVETSDMDNVNLNYTGKKPQNGKIAIGTSGKIYLVLYDGKYCIKKEYEGDEIIITKNALNDCGFDLTYVPEEPYDLMSGNYPTDEYGANKPILVHESMIPIIWDEDAVDGEGDWVELSDGDEWYNYGERQWANAKTVGNDGETIAYWVWIPRYAYKITNGFHGSVAGAIDIEFLNGTSNQPYNGGIIIKTDADEYDGTLGSSKNTTNNYFLHPAFKFGEDNIPGFWVAKFEPSGTQDSIKILPEVEPFVNKSVSVFYSSAESMKSYICNSNCDTHMMKNMEWGAVAYLSRSQYGNPQEMWYNSYYASYKFKTGCAASNVYALSQPTCVKWNEDNGPNASTTGNVYGVYDMKGGTSEYVMGNLNNISKDSEFSNPVGINTKYIDVYCVGTTDSAQTNYEATINRYGDAIWETSLKGEIYSETSWCGVASSFITSSSPWLVRGGNAGLSGAGVFCFRNSNGSGGSIYSFRPVALIF